MSWSLAAQLRLAFGAALLMTLGVVAGAWWGARNYGNEINRAYQTQLRTTVRLAEAQSAFLQLRFGLRQFMIETPEGQQQILEEQDKLYAIIETRLAAYDQAASSMEERRTLTSLRAAYQRYRQVRPKFFELWQAGQKDDAIAWVALATAPFGAEAARQFEAQIALQQSFVSQDREQSERNAELALALVTAITIALLAMLVTGYAYAVRLLRPIRTLRTQAERMVREQLGETLAASSSSNEVAALVESFQLMSDRLLARTESLRQSRERLDFLLRATPAVIYSGQAHGDYAVTFASANVRDVLGYEPEAFLRDPRLWLSNIHPDDHERVFAPSAAPARPGGYVRDYRFRHKNGSWRWLHDEFTVIRDSAGAQQEVIGCCVDVTERHRAEAASAEALRAKTEFMANVTHELRTPLNSVIGFAELLKAEVPGPLNAKQAAFAADILASGERLLALVEGILEVSRLDARGAALEREPVEIGALLEARAASHHKAAVARGVTMRLDVAPDAGRAELDPKALRRMLDALIDNAIKFNREGGAVAVSARRAGGAIEIAVADTGIGIARADLAKLFKPFAQLDAGLARRCGGVGLGLALARRLAELHGGTIEVASEPGTGSTFTLRFPIEEHS